MATLGINNTIGGTTAAARNIISGNSPHGILISYPEADGNYVQGNYIGTDVTGKVRDPDGILDSGDELGNGSDGVSIQVDADDNTIGSTTAGEGNIISGGDGVEVRYFIDPDNPSLSDPDPATGNRILSNSMYQNDTIGIDLIHSNNPDGVTFNDDGDGDGGIPPDPAAAPNRLQNFPVITSARLTTRLIGGQIRTVTIIRGTLNSTPSKATQVFTLQFFGGSTADPSGFGEGKRFLGQMSVTTNGSGNATFTFETRKKVRKGQVVTTTATNQSTRDTSEFSEAQTVT